MTWANDNASARYRYRCTVHQTSRRTRRRMTRTDTTPARHISASPTMAARTSGYAKTSVSTSRHGPALAACA